MLDGTILLGLTVVFLAGGILLIFRNPRISKLFVREIPNRSRRRLFLAAVSFALAFTIARTLAYVNFHYLGQFPDTQSSYHRTTTCCSLGNDPFTNSVEYEFRRIMQVQFLKDMATMRFNSVEADVKCGCNLFIRPSFG